MEAYTGTAVTSQERCWRCGTALWRLTPPVQGGWEFYCPACQHLTLTRTAAEEALRATPPGAIGVVVAWPYRLEGAAAPRLRPDERDGTRGSAGDAATRTVLHDA